ncbi:uncharacterized protein LOC129605653 [Condylostylus longicornis]|uniref:uncharacterized protein LOC129605653 n=1 Tax=Condylostylus longicornis TaxID=2530218 RepID=UPI00244DF61D|nr:uncharacterized protein LOC129605653 [Condylostylus longicornis]
MLQKLSKQKSAPKLWTKVREKKVPSLTKERKGKGFHWLDMILDMEKNAIEEAMGNRIKVYDLSKTLPEKLHKRVARVVPVIPREKDLFERDLKDEIVEKVEKPKAPKFTDIVKKKAFHDLPKPPGLEDIITKMRLIRIEPTFDEKRYGRRKIKNWQSGYLGKTQRERVIWNTKLYDLETNIMEKSLYDQAEHLMDETAENFCLWLNTLGRDRENDITKEYLRSLFSIEENEKLLKSIQQDPKKPKTIKDALQGAKLLKISEVVKMQTSAKGWKKKSAPPQDIKVAFGRTLPAYLRHFKQEDIEDLVIEQAFPLELRTRQVLFEGIGNLRSTQALIKYYLKNPHLKRPQYLVDNGFFEKAEKEALIEEKDMALYKLLDEKKPAIRIRK